jgi:hypothetical protein
VPLRWVEDAAHYDVISGALARARVSLWIATANLKDMRLEAPIGSVARARRRYESIVERFAELRARGVELRVLHGGLPSQPFRESLARSERLSPAFDWLRQCPRVHLKIIAVDGSELYLGSANLTGAGMGAKGAGRRNFELGVSTTDHVLIDAAQRRFDAIWTGRECGSCRVRASCPRPLDTGAPASVETRAVSDRAKSPADAARSRSAAFSRSKDAPAPRDTTDAPRARSKRANTKKKSSTRRARGA